VNVINIGSTKIAYKIFGNGNKTLVVDSCLGSCTAEWWHIGEALGDKYKVLLYDRAGYCNSTVSTLSRTPRNIALELNKLLKSLDMDKDIVIIGHSQGAINAVEYATMYPNQVKGLILLDPATPFDDVFRNELSETEYKKSGVDKTTMLKAEITAMSLGLGFAFKPLLKKSPPLCYYNYSDKAKNHILRALCKKSTYKTALSEFEFTHDENNTQDILNAIKESSLNNIPVILLTHSSKLFIKELEHFAHLGVETTQKIEFLWQEIMKRYLSLSSNAKHIVAPHSCHYIHLQDFELLRDSVDSFYN